MGGGGGHEEEICLMLTYVHILLKIQVWFSALNIRSGNTGLSTD